MGPDATFTIDGNDIDIIRVDCIQERPIVLKNGFGNLKKDTVYLRRGSSTDIAGTDEIAEMGASRVHTGSDCPEIQFEFANPSNHERFGHSIGTTSVLLVDSPPPTSLLSPKEGQSNPQVSTHVGPISEMMKSMSKQLSYLDQLKKTTIRPYAMFGAPSSEEMEKYNKAMALLTGIGFWLQNTGPVTASDVRIEIRGKRPDGLVVLDEYDLPQRPCNSIQMVHTIRTTPLDVHVQTYGTYWIASIHVGKIQPQAEIWIEDLLYIGATSSLVCEVEARVFADNLPSPIEYRLSVAIGFEKKAFDNYNSEDVG